jgi:hypothetical protein
MSAAGVFPSWVLLEPFVLRRDDDSSFPDETKAPTRATGTTAWGADFRVAFVLAEPPRAHQCPSRPASSTVACPSSTTTARTLKFINVTRDDGIPFGALKPGGSFTITCHTLTLESAGCPSDWKVDYVLTSGELWDANAADLLPRDILVFPRVDINRPHVAHFLFIEFGSAMRKMSVVTIDI